MAEEHEHKEETHEHKEEHKLELPKRRKRKSFWTIASLVLLVLLIISIFTGGFASIFKGGQLSGQQAADKTINYVNNVILQGKLNATVGTVTAVGNLYNVKLNIQNQVVDSYVTNDGRWLFPQGIDMNKEATPTPSAQPTQTSCADQKKVDKPEFDIYYMAFCPYGIQAMTGLYPVAKLFGDKVDIQPHYVIYEQYQGGGADYCMNNGTLCSMHGINELQEDIRQACIFKNQKDKFWDYTNCVMTTCKVTDVSTCWETCADKFSVDKTKVNDCYTNEGTTLMEAEKQLNVKNGVEGSPTMFLNGVEYTGGRAPADFQTGICCGFTTNPAECNQNLTASAATTTGSCG